MQEKNNSWLIILLVLVLIFGGYYLYNYLTKNEDTNIEENLEFQSEQIINEDINYSDISVSEAKQMLDTNQDIYIIDVSPKYDEGHILNSVNAYVGDGTLDKQLANWDKDGTYLVYCHVDSASISGAEKLVNAGFKNVYRLEGNYSAWVDAGYETIEGIENISGVIEGSLKDVTGNNQFGTGYIYNNTVSLQHKVTAQLSDIKTDSFYEGWLVDKNTNKFFSTGKMRKTPDGNWILEFIGDSNKESYDYAVITLETKIDETPEDHVIEGYIK